MVPPSRRLNGASSLTPEVDRVVLKAMDKSPNRRPLTMRQFLTEVGGLVAPGRGTDRDRRERRVREDDAVLGRVARGAEAGPAGGRGPGRRGTGRTGSGAGPRAGGHAAGRLCRDAASGAETPPPVGPRRTHGAAIAATMVSLPAAKMPGAGGHADAGREHADAGRRPQSAGQVTPPPVSATPPPQAMPVGPTPAPTPKPAAGGQLPRDALVQEGRRRPDGRRSARPRRGGAREGHRGL